jgi:hypothetical protein
MVDAGVFFDTSAPAGLKFPSPEVRAELTELNPGNISPGEVTEPKLDDDAVSRRTIAPGAVGTVEIGTGEVKTVNLDDGAVTGDKLDDDTVTGEKAGLGVMTVVNSTGDFISFRAQTVTTAEYTAIASPDPNTVYLITP